VEEWKQGGNGANKEKTDAVQVTFQIPAATPTGQYLLRVEHIALHVAQSVGGAQFYISCAQISVTGGGSGTPGPLVAFPGAYSATDPGILIDIYYPLVSFSCLWRWERGERRDDADKSKTADELYVPWTGGVDWLEGVKR